MHPKDVEGMVNSVDPQVGAVSSGSRLFAYGYINLVLYPSKELIWAAAQQNQQNHVRPVKTQISLGIRPVWSVFTVR